MHIETSLHGLSVRDPSYLGRKGQTVHGEDTVSKRGQFGTGCSGYQLYVISVWKPPPLPPSHSQPTFPHLSPS